MRKRDPNLDSLDELRSLLRLLVGGAVVSTEEMRRLLREWEQELARLQAQPPPEDTDSDETYRKFQLSRPPAQESSADLLRYALIGWLMENEARLSRGLQRSGRISRALSQLAEPWLRPIKESRLLAPLRQQSEAWQQRGRAEVERWIALGRMEELQGRNLARLALKRTVDRNISYLAHNPEVEELVQTQSSGLANEVVEEVRERTVSADTFLEGLARSLLRRAPRHLLPAPPAEVKDHAASLRHPKKKGRREEK